MLADLLRTNFCLNILAGLCLPTGVVRLKWPRLYFVYMIISDVLSVLNLVTIGVNLLAPDVPLTKRCYSGFTAMATALSITKLIACYFQKDRFCEYFDLWDRLIGSRADEILKEALLKNKKSIDKLSIFLFTVMVGPMIPWGSLPLFIKILSFIVPALEKSYLFVAVPAKFPFDPLVSPGFEFVAVFQGLAAVSVNAKLMAYDCLIYGLISSQIVQLRCLKERFKGIVSPTQKDESVDVESLIKQSVLQKDQKFLLEKWVEDHCNLVQICHSFNQLYSPVMLLQFFFSVLILCSNAFVVAAATVTKLEIVFSLGYVIVTVVQLYMLCWLGEEMMQKSLILSEDGFWQEWFDCPKEMCSSLKIIFERTKGPMKLSAFGTMSLSIETFKSITGTAYSYFMVLNQIKNKISK